jgi:hypothetical protein
MRRLNVRQGLIGGGVVAVISAAAIAGHSADPVTTFLSILAAGLVGLTLAISLFVAINRHSAP